MTTHNRLENVTLAAGADLSTHQFKIVELDANGDAVLSPLSKGFGVLQNHPDTAGQACTVAIKGLTKAFAGAAVSIGDKIRVQSGGWALAVTSGAAHPATFHIMGRAQTAASSGGLFSLELAPQLLVGVSSGAAII